MLVGTYFLEAGLLLLLAPWSDLWERNAFAAWFPAVARCAGNAFVRGGVSGVGLVTMAAGIVELAALAGARRGSPDATPGATAERP